MIACACVKTRLVSHSRRRPFETRADMDTAPSESSEPLPGPSGLSIHVAVALTIACTGNGHPTNEARAIRLSCQEIGTEARDMEA